MILEQHYLTCLAQASYFIADESSKKAVVVDPRRDVDLYLDEAKARGLTIEWVLLTHFHADFLAGHLELREKTGARIGLGRVAQAEYAFERLGDGDEIVLGDEVRLAFLETPGHTPESICILVFDRKASDTEPQAVLTGDTLFIGDVGRPDLMASVGITREELATKMYHSLRDKLMPLPDDVIVYPGHGAGSACGKALSSDTFAPLGDQKLFNYALQDMTEKEFVDLLTSGQPDAPSYFAYDAQLNKKERKTLDESLGRSLVALSTDQFTTQRSAGAQIVDTRDAAEYEPRHLDGSINIGLGGMYASWAGTVLDPAEPIVILCAPGKESESTVRLARIGFDRVVGHAHFEDVAAAHPELVRSTGRILASDLDPTSETILDVRRPGEWENGHIEGSLNIPLNQLEERIAEVPTDRPLVIHCQSGYRSSIAASLLERHGITDVRDLVGGYIAWAANEGEEAPSCSA